MTGNMLASKMPSVRNVIVFSRSCLRGRRLWVIRRGEGNRCRPPSGLGCHTHANNHRPCRCRADDQQTRYTLLRQSKGDHRQFQRFEVPCGRTCTGVGFATGMFGRLPGGRNQKPGHALSIHRYARGSSVQAKMARLTSELEISHGHYALLKAPVR